MKKKPTHFIDFVLCQSEVEKYVKVRKSIVKGESLAINSGKRNVYWKLVYSKPLLPKLTQFSKHVFNNYLTTD